MLFQKAKRKNSDLLQTFTPDGFFTAYLLSQFHFFFFALGTVILMPFSGIFLRQPLMIVWWAMVSCVGMLTLWSILHLWEGEQRGFQGLVLAHALYFVYFTGYTVAVEPSGILYLMMLTINTLLLVLFVYPRKHLMK
ncbi:MAG: hypothetical protein AAF846_27035 [Chloroflexota bacterium]